MEASSIPVIDFSSVSMRYTDAEVDETKLRDVGKQLVDVFSNIGFVYMSNTGVSSAQVDEVHATALEFFQLPETVKRCYSMQQGKSGWVPVARQRLNPDRPGDLKECFDLRNDDLDMKLPNEVPKFKEVLMPLYDTCVQLSQRLLRALAFGLEMEDTDFFCRFHTMKTAGNSSALRMLWYPPLTEDILPGQLRLGEHSDFGSLTLLFQDMVGGLQVRSRCNEWVDAVPIADTVLVNIADMMQRWTSDKLVSTKHRVLIPNDVTRRCTVRQSMTFFMLPDNDVTITCLDGSTKYKPVSYREYLQDKLNTTYDL